MPNAGPHIEFKGYEKVQREVKIGNHSRIDLLLSDGDKRRCYVEIKNCTLVDGDTALFPDAVTTRGLKHLQELRRNLEFAPHGDLKSCSDLPQLFGSYQPPNGQLLEPWVGLFCQNEHTTNKE